MPTMPPVGQSEVLAPDIVERDRSAHHTIVVRSGLLGCANSPGRF